MTIAQIARPLDLFAMAFAFGATAWFFFVQAPTLLAALGREKFVPLQMRLTLVLFRTLTALSVVVLGAAMLHAPLGSLATRGACVALAGVLVNQFVVVPRALRAGGKSRADIKGKDEEGSTTGFASEGAGNRTRMMHRLVVLFVVVMLGGFVANGLALLGQG